MALFVTKKLTAFIDSNNFTEWDQLFCKIIAIWFENNKSLFLICDCYKSHLAPKSIKSLCQSGFILFTLSHASEKEQSLGVRRFGSFKSALITSIQTARQNSKESLFDQFGFLKLMMRDCIMFFTRFYKVGLFSKSVTFHVGYSKVLGVSLSTFLDGSILLTTQQLKDLMDKKT